MLLLNVTVYLPKMLIQFVSKILRGIATFPTLVTTEVYMYVTVNLKMLYLARYCHSMTELCFSSTKLSKNFCYASCFNATCRSKPCIIIRISLSAKGKKKSQHGQGMLEVLSDSLGLVSNLSG